MNSALSAERIAERLEQIRRSQQPNMTQAEFARRIGEEPQKVNNWFRALHVPSAEAILKIEDVFQYRARWIVYGELPQKMVDMGNQKLLHDLQLLPESALLAIEELVRNLLHRNID